MKKVIFAVVFLLFVIGGAVGIFILPVQKAKGALQVTAIPKSEVFLDNVSLGATPFCKCESIDMLPIGSHTIRLVPTDTSLTPFEEKITINNSVLTVVDRTFEKESASEASIITLTPLADKKNTALLILSFPDKVDVLLDSSAIGTTPLLLKNITASDHELLLKKNGYKEKTIRIRTVAGYKLETTAFLGINQNAINATPSAVPSITPTASPSAALVPSVTILKTPTGFLRVRSEPSIASAEVGRVKPTEVYPLIDEKGGWLEIRISNNVTGWISNQYAKKQ